MNARLSAVEPQLLLWLVQKPLGVGDQADTAVDKQHWTKLFQKGLEVSRIHLTSAIQSFIPNHQAILVFLVGMVVETERVTQFVQGDF